MMYPPIITPMAEITFPPPDTRAEASDPMHALRSRGQHPLFQPAGVCILGSPLLKASGAIVTRIVQNRSLHSGKMGVAETQILRQWAEQIKSRREANGWTQEQFAERAAMQRSY